MSVQISHRKQLILGIVLLLIFLIVLEGITRIYDYFNPFCDLAKNEVYKDLDYDLKRQICHGWIGLVWYVEPDSGLFTLEPNQHHSTLNINSFSFRGPEITKAKPDEITRIFVVGGSTTLALRAISDETTIPGYLQNNFDNQKLNNVEVINAGITSLNSTGEYNLIKNKLVNFDPDMIIVYGGINDLYQPVGWTRDITIKTALIGLYKRYFSFYETPYVINAILKEINKPSKEDFDDTDITIKVSKWKKNLEVICELGKQHGFETVIVLQPILGTGNKILTEHENKAYDYWDHANAVPSYQLFADELDSLNDKCSKVEDFRNVFDEIQESVYFEGAHIGYKHNKLIADKLFELVFPLTQKVN